MPHSSSHSLSLLTGFIPPECGGESRGIGCDLRRARPVAERHRLSSRNSVCSFVPFCEQHREDRCSRHMFLTKLLETDSMSMRSQRSRVTCAHGSARFCPRTPELAGLPLAPHSVHRWAVSHATDVKESGDIVGNVMLPAELTSIRSDSRSAIVWGGISSADASRAARGWADFEISRLLWSRFLTVCSQTCI